MKNHKDIQLRSTSTLKNALKIIDDGAMKIALVIGEYEKLLGTITDGDIRRALLSKKTLNDTIKDVYFKNPVTAKKDISRENLQYLCKKNKINQVPIVDDDRRIIDLFIMDSGLPIKQYENHVVLMVGGFGTRLRPLTNNIPKPMLNVGNKPILQTIIEGFANNNFRNITMCLGYKSNIIQNYFQDGGNFGVNIEYIVEEKRMGTAGALTLLKNKLNKPVFVMNGDLLTNINFEKMLDFHESSNSKATMCVREYDVEVPYGVVSVDGEKIVSIEEKPVHRFFVNAGVYLLEPECIDLIPSNKFYDMPSLFEELIKSNRKTTPFPLKEYWLDIGRIADYEKANSEYHSVF